jgi:hypothetical protein
MEVWLIASIKIGIRHRKDMGDIAGLAASIAEIGLLHPIVVRADGTLIAGERRLEACKQLGWVDVSVNVVDIDEVVRGELAENAERKDFLPSEIDAIRKALEPVVATPVGRPSKEMVEIFHHSEAGKTRDKIGAFAGVSGRTVEKIAAVVEAAEAEPAKFGHLVEEQLPPVPLDHQQFHDARRRADGGMGFPPQDGADVGEATVGSRLVLSESKRTCALWHPRRVAHAVGQYRHHFRSAGR